MVLKYLGLGKAEEVCSVVEADIFNDFAELFKVGRDFTGVNPAAEQVAEDAAEIFVTRV